MRKTYLCQKHMSDTKSFNMPVLIGLTTHAYMLNGCEICLNTAKYPILNMQVSDRLDVHFNFGLFWSAGIPTMTYKSMSLTVHTKLSY